MVKSKMDCLGVRGDKIYDKIYFEKLLHYIIACHLQLFCVSRKISAISELLSQKACLKLKFSLNQV